MDFTSLLVNEYGLDITKNGKFIKHADSVRDLRELWITDRLELYQSFQNKDVFNCDFIITFIGEEEDKARFLGIYDVIDKMPAKDSGYSMEERKNVYADDALVYYQLKKRPGFEDVEGSIIIKWGGSRGWHHSVSNTKKIWQILPRGFYKPFPGIEKVNLTYKELKYITKNKDANIEWYYGLSCCKGVYIILDILTGQQYIGSAISEEGIWKRWLDYVNTGGHGDNQKLIEIINRDSKYAENFKFSVVKFFPKEIAKHVVTDMESYLKEALGTRIYGLNAN